MKIQEILDSNKHRPWSLPSRKWKYYQEWNNAVFLHWQVDFSELRKLVPEDIKIDLFDGKAWVSLVAFSMEKIRPKNLPHFSPISNFDEINIRTYVKYKGKTGVYFLSIEGGTKVSCQVAKRVSELPYRYSKMIRQENHYSSVNSEYNDSFDLVYQIGRKSSNRTDLDKWLTERYALFQDTVSSINEFDIQHVEWPTFEIDLKEIKVNYPRFDKLLSNSPSLSHYSTGVQVIAWDKKKNKRLEAVV